MIDTINHSKIKCHKISANDITNIGKEKMIQYNMFFTRINYDLNNYNHSVYNGKAKTVFQINNITMNNIKYDDDFIYLFYTIQKYNCIVKNNDCGKFVIYSKRNGKNLTDSLDNFFFEHFATVICKLSDNYIVEHNMANICLFIDGHLTHMFLKLGNDILLVVEPKIDMPYSSIIHNISKVHPNKNIFIPLNDNKNKDWVNNDKIKDIKTNKIYYL